MHTLRNGASATPTLGYFVARSLVTRAASGVDSGGSEYRRRAYWRALACSCLHGRVIVRTLVSRLLSPTRDAHTLRMYVYACMHACMCERFHKYREEPAADQLAVGSCARAARREKGAAVVRTRAFNICKLGRVCIYASVIPMYTSADRRGAGFVR